MSDQKCTACGRPQWPDDNFCAGCGEPNRAALAPEQIDLSPDVTGDDGRDRETPARAATGESARLRRILIGLVGVLGAIIAVTTLLGGGSDLNDSPTAEEAGGDAAGDAAGDVARDPFPGETAATPTPTPTPTPTVDASPTDGETQSPERAATPNAAAQATGVTPTIVDALLTEQQAAHEDALRTLGGLGLGSGWLVNLDQAGNYWLLNLETAELRDPDLLRIKVGQSFERVLSGGLLVETSSGALGSSWVWSPWDESGVLGFDTDRTFTLAVLDDRDSGPVIVLQRVDEQTAYAVQLLTGDRKEILWSEESVNTDWVAAAGGIWLPTTEPSVWRWNWADGWTQIDAGEVPSPPVEDAVVVQCSSPTECLTGLVHNGEWTAVAAFAPGTRMLSSPDRRWYLPLGTPGQASLPASPDDVLARPGLMVFDAAEGSVLPLVGVRSFTRADWLTNDAILFQGPIATVAALDQGVVVDLPGLQAGSFWWFTDLVLE